MTGQQVKQAYQHKQVLRSYLASGVIIDAGQDWINGELASMEREMRGEVLQEMKNARLGGRTLNLRSRLKQLVMSILAHREVERNA